MKRNLKPLELSYMQHVLEKGDAYRSTYLPGTRANLAEVFFMLNASKDVRGEVERAPRGNQTHTLREVFAMAEGRFLLFGDPGAGKTTSLHYVAHNLARAYFNIDEQPIAAVKRGIPMLLEMRWHAYDLARVGIRNTVNYPAASC